MTQVVATSQAQRVALPKAGTNTVLAACTVTPQVGQQDCEPVLCTGFKKESLLNPRTNQTGRVTFDTELISMELTGFSPSLGTVIVRAGQQQGLPPSLGGGTSLSNNAAFPADSFFDVFVEVNLPQQSLTGNDGIGTHRVPPLEDCEDCSECNHFEGKLTGKVTRPGSSAGAKIEAVYAGTFVGDQGDPLECCPPPALPPSGPLRMTIEGVVIHHCIPL